MEAQYS